LAEIAIFPLRVAFASLEIRMISGPNSKPIVNLVDFPQFFPQVWKTLGRDQTHMRLFGDRTIEKDADFNTKPLRLTPAERVRYDCSFGETKRRADKKSSVSFVTGARP
jgi:hypothetical protein